MPNLEDQLKRTFGGRVDRVRQALEQSRQERSRFANAEESRRQHEADIAEAEAEMQRLPGQAAKKLLTSDSGDGAQAVDDLRGRYQELEETVADRKKRLKELDGVLNHEDVRTAEQLSIGRCQQLAHGEVQAARKERDELVRVLDEALAELEGAGREATNIRQVYTRETQEAS